LGNSLQRIEFIETLGRGGFGAVYLANVTRSDTLVQRLAVKLMNADHRDEPDLVARQRDEARLLAQLNHDHIVKVMDMTEIHGLPALIMEYVEGADCTELLRDGPLPTRAALEIIAGTASALAAAWSTPNARTGSPLHVIHRDIKPSNLLVSRHGGLKVLDFGVARAEFDREGKTTAFQFGTARFMAPEQWLLGSVSHLVDIYALGISAIEIMKGSRVDRMPLDRACFEKTVEEQLSSLPLDALSTHSRLKTRALIRRMVKFSPHDRPTAAELYIDCASLLEDVPGPSLERVAVDRIPPLIDARRAVYRRDPLLSDFKPGTSAPVEEAFPDVDIEESVEPGSEDTLIRRRASSQSRPQKSSKLRWRMGTLFGMAGGTWMLWSLPQAPPSQRSSRDVDSPSSEVSQSKNESVLHTESFEPGGSEPSLVEVETPTMAQDSASTSASPSRSPTDTTTTRPSMSPSPVISPVTPPIQPVPLIIVSDPWGATVSLNGKEMGRTPLKDLSIDPGTYQLVFEFDGQVSTHEVHVLENRKNHFSWRMQSDELVLIGGRSP
jgi:serine/threonine protein kinase